MTSFSDALAHGTTHAWLFIPSAILLGALHGLEPGHSKTMMAAFIIAIRGTVGQAVLLGLSAAFSHSLVIWLLAAVALKWGSQWNAETTEPYFQLVSAGIIAALALWMFWRTRRDARAAAAHGHPHPHAHSHDEAHSHPHEPHAHGHERHGHSHEEGHTHGHEPHAHEHGGHEDDAHGGPAPFQDAHELAHAADIEQRFAGRAVTTPQIVLFGLTGGLLPCPAAFTVLLVCLQVKQFTLGFALVAAFSFGLALTMVTVGAAAAWSVGHVEKRWSGFGELMRKAPYISCALLLALAAYMATQGWRGLPH